MGALDGPIVRYRPEVASARPPDVANAVFVLGMHRSGTSALTRAINMLGVPVNVPSDWLAPVPQVNAKGFWESAALQSLNEEILGLLGGNWTTPPQLGAGWATDPRLDDLRVRAPQACGTVFPSDQWAWKDPRNCLTLPFWLDALDVQPTIVITHRSPVEIAMSLLRRDGFPLRHSLALWERYVRSSLAVAVGLPTFVVDYGELLDDPLTVTEALRAFLTSEAFETVAPEEVVLREFLSPDLRHSRFPDQASWSKFGVSPEQMNLHTALSDVKGAHKQFQAIDFGPETLGTEAIFDSLRKRAFSRSVTPAAHDRLGRLEHLWIGVEKGSDAASRAIAALESHTAALEARIAPTEARLAELEAARLADAAEIAVLRGTVDALSRSRAVRMLTAPGRVRNSLRRRAGTQRGVQPRHAPR